MAKAFFITGIGTGIGKTFVATLICKSTNAYYWKPIQAGLEITDTDFLKKHISPKNVFLESYRLKHAESAHSSAQKEKIKIDINLIKKHYQQILKQLKSTDILIVEGVGGAFSPINDEMQNVHLIKKLNIQTIVVSKNYLGSLNHSLVLSEAFKLHKIKTLGWVFINYQNNYEKEIVRWSGIEGFFSFRNLQAKDLKKTLPIMKKINQKFKQFLG